MSRGPAGSGFVVRLARSATVVTGLSAFLIACGTGEYPAAGPPSETGTAETDTTETEAAEVVDAYLDAYFSTFPSRATAAGRHDLDHALEKLDGDGRRSWMATNDRLGAQLRSLRDRGGLDEDDRLDVALVLREVDRQRSTFQTLRTPERDPLFWTGLMSNAVVFLLVRDDAPEAERLDAAVARASKLPRLVADARGALEATPASEIAPELCQIAARQARASATFFRTGFADAAGDDDRRRQAMVAAGREAAVALDGFAVFMDDRGAQASGSPRLGPDAYAERFRLVTGIDRPVADVLAEAEAALADKRDETAAYGREIWSTLWPEAAPDDDRVLIRRLFDRVAEDRAEDVETFVADYQRLVAAAIDFVRENEIITLPEPLTLVTDRSPSYFVGQSVGGVYPAGPYTPEADTLFFLPTPSDDADAAQQATFFRAFNDHFNVMITPHEMVPGHYLQLKYAARHPRKVRALFGDGVYIEGWGTFCERLMLDLGWGGPLDRVAHLKKQLENIARTIVDIRVHSHEMSRDEMLAFVRDEALQDEQFAGNMWQRTLTSAPQLTFYFLGYQAVWGLYEDMRTAQGSAFSLRGFMDGMMALGPVAVEHYRARWLS